MLLWLEKVKKNIRNEKKKKKNFICWHSIFPNFETFLDILQKYKMHFLINQR